MSTNETLFFEKYFEWNTPSKKSKLLENNGIVFKTVKITELSINAACVK